MLSATRHKVGSRAGLKGRRRRRAGGVAQKQQEEGENPRRKRAVVVGLGVGGLVMAGRLARSGYEVIGVEKNERSGGRMQSEASASASGYRFDTGPSLLLFPDKYREAFNAMGARLEDWVTLRRVEPAYRVHYSQSGSFLDLSYDTQAMMDQLNQVESGAGAQFLQWLRKARVTLDRGLRAFIEQDVRSALDFVDPRRVLAMALEVGPLELLRSQHSQMSKYFRSERLRALFSYQNLYVGLSPYSAPGVFSLLAATELTDGVWYPEGGFQTVRDALERVASGCGVQLRYGESVAEIATSFESEKWLMGKSLRARGVRLASGEVIESDLVVANADLPFVYREMLPHSQERFKQESSKLNDEMAYSCAVISFNWSVSSKQAQLLHHNVFLSERFQEGWDRPWHPDQLKARQAAHFYVHKPSYTDPSAAPDGCESVMVLMPVANLQETREKARSANLKEPSRQALIDAAREVVLQQMEACGVTGIRNSIESEFVIDRESWGERYNLTHGAAFGLSHNIFQLGCFRPPVQSGFSPADSPTVSKLYFVGASTRPGNGVPLVMMGCKTTHERILANEGYGDPSAELSPADHPAEAEGEAEAR